MPQGSGSGKLGHFLLIDSLTKWAVKQVLPLTEWLSESDHW